MNAVTLEAVTHTHTHTLCLLNKRIKENKQRGIDFVTFK